MVTTDRYAIEKAETLSSNRFSFNIFYAIMPNEELIRAGNSSAFAKRTLMESVDKQLRFRKTRFAGQESVKTVEM